MARVTLDFLLHFRKLVQILHYRPALLLFLEGADILQLKSEGNKVGKFEILGIRLLQLYFDRDYS